MAKKIVKVCVDLDILLDFLTGDEKASEKIEIYVKTKDTELCIAATTLAELYILTKSEEIVEKVKEGFIILPFDENVAKIAKEVYDALEENKWLIKNIQMSKVYVAATCIAHEAFLLTKNRQYYSNIPKLKVL
jgi:predicted nucleic acid-binding protein